MDDQHRFSVKTWKKDSLQAASMNCGCCRHGHTVGVDMNARDGSTFAHGHFDVATAKQFHQRLGEAIAEAEAALTIN